jgi:hypothetical protein
MVILFEEMLADPLAICGNIFKWLNIDDDFKPHLKKHNETTIRESKNYSRLITKLLRPNSILRKPAELIIPSHLNHKLGNALRGFNKTRKKYPPMDAATRQFLLNYFDKYNKDLEELIGKKVAALWNK